MLLFPIRTFSIALIAAATLAASPSQATTVAAFDVVLTGDISGVAPGTINSDPSNDPSGFGLGGSATLDDAGILTIQYRSHAVTEFTNTVQNAEAIFTGSFGDGILTSPSGQFRALDCTENGGLIAGCPFVSSSGTFPSPFTALSNLPSSIVFDLALGGVTTFQASAVIPNTTTVFTYNLTTIPEPGTAMLMGGGLLALAARRRRA